MAKATRPADGRPDRRRRRRARRHGPLPHRRAQPRHAAHPGGARAWSSTSSARSSKRRCRADGATRPAPSSEPAPSAARGRPVARSRGRPRSTSRASARTPCQPQEQGHRRATSRGPTPPGASLSRRSSTRCRASSGARRPAPLAADVLRARDARQADRVGPRRARPEGGPLARDRSTSWSSGLVTGLALNGAGDRPRLRAGGGRAHLGGRGGRARLRRLRDGAGDRRGDQPRDRGGRPRRPGPGRGGRALPRGAASRHTCGVSLLAAAWRLGLPATVHVAVGTDIVHMHPGLRPGRAGPRHAPRLPHLRGPGGAPGRRRRLPERRLGGAAARGLPEGGDPGPQPRPRRSRTSPPPTWTSSSPTGRTRTSCTARRAGVGRGYSLTGHHEILVPLLAAALVEGT